MALLLGPGCGDEEPNRPTNVIPPSAGADPASPAGAPASAATSSSPSAAPNQAAVGSPGAPTEATDPALFGAAASRSRLVIVGRSPGGRGVIALGAPATDDRAGYPAALRNGILARELIRQAMLIAARDELGLATRDEVLGDSLPASSGAPALHLGSFMSSGNGTMQINHAFVTRGEEGRAERLLKVALPCPYTPEGELRRLVEAAEALSRREFPAVLGKLGAVGKPHPVRADAKLPAGVEAGLEGLGLTGVLAAVRAVHESIRADGESPARLGALARGYALLGVLSEFHWHPAHKAFKARALLYAQRLAAREPKSPWALWHRAYARALVGMHRDAIADLAAAATAEQAGKPSPRPDWVSLVEGLAHQDGRRLATARGSQARLAALLRLLAVEFPVNSQQTLEAARQLVELDPECFRGHDAMCRVGGISIGHTATTLGPEAFARMVPQSLKAMPGLPKRVRDFLGHPVGGDAALFELLEKSGGPGEDPGEPSWSVMGHLLRETRFVQVFRRLHFMRIQWAVPTDEYWDEARPSVAGHRFYPALEILAVRSADPYRPHARFFEQLTRLELEPVEVGMIHILQQSRDKNAMRAWYTAELHIDQVARDLAAVIQDTQPDAKVMFGRTLLEISPDSPFAIATLIENDKESGPKLAGWEKKAGDSPVVLGALARLSAEQKKPEQAERYLNRYVEREPEYWAYRMLADNYKARGDNKRWQEALERCLTVEDRGLQHAQTRVDLADYFMEQGQWSKAKVHAEAAAETWASWAMACAQRCAEGMKDWPRAELWAQRQSDRYREQPDSLFRWFLFCVKTGRGNLQAAHRFTEELLRDRGGIEALHPDHRGHYQWLNGDLKGAASSFRESYERAPSFGTCLMLIAAADLLGDRATVAEYRKRLLAQHRREAPEIVRIVELLPDTLEPGNSRPPDLKAVDRALETMPPLARPSAEYWIGLFLKAHGQMAAARPYLEHCVPSRVIPEWSRAIAGQAIRSGRR